MSAEENSTITIESVPGSPGAVSPRATVSLAQGQTDKNGTQVIRLDADGHLYPGKPLTDAQQQLKLPGYEFLSLLGTGGMGDVYLARQLSLDRHVAIKMIRRTASEVPTGLADEARTLAMLNHPNVMGCHDIIQTEDGLYLVMEYIPGRLTARMLVERFGQLPEDTVVRILLDVVNGMSFVNQKGLLHRDMKPDNLMIYQDQPDRPFKAEELFKIPGTRTVICDFGIAIARNALADSDKIIGSPMYMSPEQATGIGDLDCRSDIYSLGCVAYFLLTAQMPFNQKTSDELLDYKMLHDLGDPREHNPSISRELARIVQRMGRVLPDERYQNYEELKDDLERLSTEESRWFSVTRRKTRSHSMVKGAFIGLLLAILCQIAYELHVYVIRPYLSAYELSLCHALGYWRHTDAQPWKLITSDPDEKGIYMRGYKGTGPIVLMQQLGSHSQMDLRIRFFGQGTAEFGLVDKDEKAVMKIQWRRLGSTDITSFRIISENDRMNAGTLTPPAPFTWVRIQLSLEGDRVIFSADGKVMGVCYLPADSGDEHRFFIDSSQTRVLEIRDVYLREN